MAQVEKWFKKKVLSAVHLVRATRWLLFWLKEKGALRRAHLSRRIAKFTRALGPVQGSRCKTSGQIFVWKSFSSDPTIRRQ